LQRVLPRIADVLVLDTMPKLAISHLDASGIGICIAWWKHGKNVVGGLPVAL
jgi:hypothetical protein